MKKNPLVSVIMPVYNGEKYLSAAIDSILGQTYKNLELIIVDDASEDNTTSIIKNYQKKFSGIIKGIFLKKNVGESAAANVGFRLSSGEFVARMDADDVSHLERIEKQVKFMQKHKEVVVLGTQGEVIDKNGTIVGNKRFPCDHDEIYRLYAIIHPMLHPSCMFRRILLPYKNKLWENTHEPNDDYFTLFKLLNYGKFANLGECLVCYRIHGGNKSLQDAKKKILNSIKIRLDAIKFLGYKPSFFAIVFNIFQFIALAIVPEKAIVPLYMTVRGMKKLTWKYSKPYKYEESVASLRS